MTHYNRVQAPPVKNLSPTMMEDTGYLDAKSLVETMTIAGQKLTDNRSAQYDTAGFTESNDDIAAERMLNEDVPINPANRPGLTEMDAIDILRATTERLEEQARNKKETVAVAPPAPEPPVVADSPKSEGV